MIFQKKFLCSVYINPENKNRSYMQVTEMETRQKWRIEYSGDGNFHSVFQDNMNTNVDSWREALVHILMFPSKIIYDQYYQTTRKNHLKGL